MDPLILKKMHLNLLSVISIPVKLNIGRVMQNKLIRRASFVSHFPVWKFLYKELFKINK